MESTNRPFRRRRFPFVLIIVAGAFLLGAIVQFLWNNILPDLIQVGQLTYWKALGLLILCRILFGGFRGGPPGGGRFGKNGWREKWNSMSEEEKARFKEKWRSRCSKNG